MPYTQTDETIDRAWRELAPAILAPVTPPPACPGPRAGGLPARAVARLRPEIAARIREIVRTDGALTEADLARLGLTADDTAAMRDLILAEARKAADAAERRA